MYSELHFSGYKSFPPEKDASLKDLRHVNVIIGKNNCGKSSVLDLVATPYSYDCWAKVGSKIELLDASFELEEEHIGGIFSQYSSIGNVQNPHNVALQSLGKLYSVSLGSQKLAYQDHHELKYTFSEIHSDETFRYELFAKFWRNVADNICKENTGWEFRRISADRDIVPEAESQKENIMDNGVGTSNLIRKIINHSDFDEKLIEHQLLNALNEIMAPEIEFVEFKIQQITVGDDLLWEVFLREKGCGRYALSQSGSGLKTIILLLLNLLVIPQTKQYKGKKIIFAFEELENNLHPFIQRKIFDYIYNHAVENDVYVFLTTHSHIAINAYFGKEDASVYHVSRHNGESTIKKVDNYIDKVEILDDLDVKASDLLQSNGIIWVEGPSDRIYIKAWLEIFCDCKYEEGKHYQFMYYGGRLLAHYSAEETTGLINILLTNRNAAIVIDSDKRNQHAHLNSTKKRIIAEFSEYNMMSWVTKGKEIENYISADVLSVALGKGKVEQCSQFQLFPEYISGYSSNFSEKKVEFANKVKRAMNKDNSKGILNLEQQVKKLYANIEKWNS
jgi:hypothetical protein